MKPAAASAAHADLVAGAGGDRDALIAAEHDDPHRYLGPHELTAPGGGGTVVRVLEPDAENVEVVPPDGEAVAADALGEGLFAAWLPGVRPQEPYRLRIAFPDGVGSERDDPYRFAPTVGEIDLYLIGEGTQLQLWECLGARPLEVDGVAGFAFAVWAPNARRVSLVGDFCAWDGRRLPMRRLGGSGVFEIFVPGLRSGTVYKYEILTQDGSALLKADPLARWSERPPATASRCFRSRYRWQDVAWMAAHAGRDVTREPMAIYEVHPGSFMHAEDAMPGEDEPRELQWRVLAPKLVEHVKLLGFNYIELMPVAEHPFGGSWGYQITGYYAPTARYGDPDDLRAFVDHCHQNGIGVIVDWVPAHFVKDAHGLGRFDGSALYEHQDPRQGLHPDWDTYIFNLGRNEVRSFLVANALYWLEEFHIDGLRVDAVASMLYLDYSREEGEWVPNVHGGRENLESIAFLQAFNEAVREHYPGRFTVAEESTAWPGVTAAVAENGLGFTLKWNMGWMHDTLSYFATDPLFRSHHHDRLTFAMIYENSERFINPLSHDEVVHGKGSLYDKMPGDPWRKLANLRTLYTYQLTRPGKKLLFMGSELGPTREWDHESALDWYLLGDPDRRGLFLFVCDLGALYRRHPCLWRSDPDPESFRWVACWDRECSIISYERRLVEPAQAADLSAADRLLVVLNLTPVPREDYRIGVPVAGTWRRLLSSDAKRYGGSGYPTAEDVVTETAPADDQPQSLRLSLPPLAALVLQPLAEDDEQADDGLTG